MSEIVSKAMDKIIDEFFNEKQYASVTCYLFSGILGVLCIVSQIAPFVCSNSFLDGVILKGNLSDSDLVVSFPVVMILVYSLSILARHKLLRLFEVTKKSRKPFVHLLTLVDMCDLFASLGSLLFMISTFIQMYKTGYILMTKTAFFIYGWISINFIALIYARYARINSRIIDNSLNRYPEES